MIRPFKIDAEDCKAHRRVRLRNGKVSRLDRFLPYTSPVVIDDRGVSYNEYGLHFVGEESPDDIVGFVDDATPQVPPETPALEAGVTVAPIYKTADGKTFESAEAANEYARRKSAHQDLVSAMERGKILGLGAFCGLPFYVDFSRYATDREIVDAKLRLEKIIKTRDEEILAAVKQLTCEGGAYQLVRRAS